MCFLPFHCSFQTDKKGCATFIFSMLTFTKLGQKALKDQLHVRAKVEEEGTGKSNPILCHIHMWKREIVALLCTGRVV